jgi:DNA repair exonuclease SbcCD nuclease subunit
MARILHLSDLHLDRAFSGLAFAGCDGSRRRQLLRQALEWAVDLAVARRPDLVTLGGDLFEQEHVTSDTVAFITRQLARAECPVLLVSGNHDFAGPASPYRTAGWPPNVVLRLDHRLEPLPAGDSTVWAFGYNGPNVPAELLTGFTAPRDGRIQLLLAHGIDLSISTEEPGRLGLTEDDVRDAGFDHALLGHIHAGHVGERISSPGSPVPLHPGETTGNHGALWVETANREVRVEALTLELATFATVSLDLAGVGDSSALEDALRLRIGQDPSPATALVSVRLHGRRPTTLIVDTDALAGSLAGACLGVNVADTSEPEVDLEELAREPNARGTALRRLLASGSEEALLAARLVVEAFESGVRVPV